MRKQERIFAKVIGTSLCGAGFAVSLTFAGVAEASRFMTNNHSFDTDIEMQLKPYLDNGGTKYIDLGLKTSKYVMVDTVFSLNRLTPQRPPAYGRKARTDGIFGNGVWNADSDFMVGIAENGYLRGYFGGPTAGTHNNILMAKPTSVNESIHLLITRDAVTSGTVTQGSQDPKNFSARSTLGSATSNFYVFRSNSTNGDISDATDMKLYNFKLYSSAVAADLNESLIRDLVPVYYVDGTEAKFAMLDLVTGAFYTGNGSGNFSSDVAQGSASTLSGYSDADGGVVFNSGVIKVGNTIFSDNAATARGGAVYNSGELIINESKFSGNTAGTYGGAVYNEGTLSVSGSVTFNGNVANGDMNDIYNCGVLDFVGNVTMDGGIKGETGTVNIGDGSSVTKVTMTGTAGIGGQSIFFIKSNAALDMGAASGNIDGAGEIINEGVFTSGSGYVMSDLTNRGTVKLEKGFFDGNINNDDSNAQVNIGGVEATDATTCAKVTGAIINTHGKINLSNYGRITGTLTNGDTMNMTGGVLDGMVYNNSIMNVSGGETGGTLTNTSIGTLKLSGTGNTAAAEIINNGQFDVLGGIVGKVKNIGSASVINVNKVESLTDSILNEGTINFSNAGILNAEVEITGGNVVLNEGVRFRNNNFVDVGTFTRAIPHKKIKNNCFETTYSRVFMV